MSIIRKKVKITVLIVAVILIATIVLLGIYEGGFFFLAPGYNKTDGFAKNNIDELSYVSDALSELDYYTIEIRKFPLRDEDIFNMVVRKDELYNFSPNGSDRETIPIPDELVGHIKHLYESGVEKIFCGSDSVDFTMWNTMSESRGIKYSKTGNPPDVWAAIEVKQLSKENWYYYVSNYEKAKARNPQLFQ